MVDDCPLSGFVIALFTLSMYPKEENNTEK